MGGRVWPKVMPETARSQNVAAGTKMAARESSRPAKTFPDCSGPTRAQPRPLSLRQAEVVKLVASGLSDKEIANKLGLKETTIGSYLKTVFRRFGVHTRTALAVRMLKGGNSEITTAPGH